MAAAIIALVLEVRTVGINQTMFSLKWDTLLSVYSEKNAIFSHKGFYFYDSAALKTASRGLLRQEISFLLQVCRVVAPLIPGIKIPDI